MKARERAVDGLTAALGCRRGVPLEMVVALHRWNGFIDSLTVEWIQNEELELDTVVKMAMRVLVAAIDAVYADPYDHQSEVAALSRVAS